MEKELLRPSLVMFFSVIAITLIQLFKIRDSLLLEEKLKLAIQSTHRLAFGFFLLSIIIVITAPYFVWVMTALWIIAGLGIVLHLLMVFGKPEKWANLSAMLSMVALLSASLIGFIGTFS